MENHEVCVYLHGLNLTVCLPASLYSECPLWTWNSQFCLD
ncbi:hypothetical protein LEMLEM_LOCUS7888 [Lemmus lemmus]